MTTVYGETRVMKNAWLEWYVQGTYTKYQHPFLLLIMRRTVSTVSTMDTLAGVLQRRKNSTSQTACVQAQREWPEKAKHSRIQDEDHLLSEVLLSTPYTRRDRQVGLRGFPINEANEQVETSKGEEEERRSKGAEFIDVVREDLRVDEAVEYS
ncbi:hypothetical protein BDP27DRAFT_1366213 [Rhodocollybia butyracea]|uniref:Uncharacterized protein n=1 Tax=Rhodocollybia butyracea TaxID=206335 RepID=A0A9P5PPP0_9AGAR|nr:hypothetical protein BDP27DRAFT_1366213 [Rhodocollybia butyracea]